jgi:CRP-like cAMP-binding protein
MKLIKKKEELLKHYIEKYKLEIIDDLGIINQLQLVEFEKDEYIYEMSESVDYFYFFVKGKAKVYTMMENGKRLLLRFYRPLMVIGDLEFANNDMNHASTNIKTLSKVHCIRVSMAILRKKYSDDAQFIKFINHSLAEKLESLSISSSINLLYPLENRLASYLMYLYSGPEEKVVLIDQLADIAELLGTSYRHLLRIFKLFSNREFITRERNKITIIDEDSLQKLAGNLYQ